MGKDGEEKAFLEMGKECGKKPIATTAFVMKKYLKGETTKQMSEFVSKLK